ncbi:MAG: ribosome-associated translation inhibitor RaiA [Desulfuromonadaceae bacterium]|nr:ribosome-associated translation inhibitor RaiA [Desulfuromonas sp.]MDY0184683.1 ribosome-associated translation inhibitor RaiA [Desulfuromonadaceae bacterium]
MQIAVTFRHMDSSDPVREYVEEKLTRVKKYIEEPIEAQAVLEVEKKIRNIAEVVLTAKGVTIKASAEVNDDMYAAIDAVVDKIERQLKRYKEKLKDHSPRKGKGRFITKTIIEAASIDDGADEPKVVTTRSFSIKPMSVDEAVMQMDLMYKDFLVFTDDSTEDVNVIYRRKDGNYGLIVPER